MGAMEFFGIAMAIVGAYAIGHFRGMRAGMAVPAAAPPDQAPGVVDLRPPSQRPSPVTNLCQASEAEAGPKFPFQVGERFTYLGLTMLCSRHVLPSEFLLMGQMARVPSYALFAEYVCGQGKVNVATFMEREWPALLAESQRAGVGVINPV